MSAPILLYGYFGFSWRPDGTLRLGWPFIFPDGSLDAAVVAQHARWPVVVLEVDACLARPDIIAALRAANPAIRVLGFLNLGQVWANPDHSLNWDTDANRLIVEAAKAHNGYLWSANMPAAFYDPWNGPTVGKASWCNANLASAEFCDALFTIIADAAKMLMAVGDPRDMRSIFDGLFLDLAGSRIPRDASKDVPDYARAGFVESGGGFDIQTPWERFDTAFAANHAALVRNLFSAGVKLVLNDGGLTPYSEQGFLAGSMRESFPLKPDGLDDWPGWFAWAQQVAAKGGEPWINAVPPSRTGTLWSIADPANREFALFALATAYLTGARLSLTTNERPAEDERWAQWLPEYGLDLGAPLGPVVAFKGGWLREFERGAVTVHPATRTGRILLAS